MFDPQELNHWGQVFKRLLRQEMWSLALESREGFWSSRIGNTVAALRAIDSRAELVAKFKAVDKQAISETKDSPTLPCGT